MNVVRKLLRKNAASKNGERWWCTPCHAWRRPIRDAGPPMCSACRSGAIRPPREGEQVPT